MQAFYKSITLLLAAIAMAHSATAVAQDPNAEIVTLPVAPGIYMLTGSGGNLGLSVGEDGAFLIDDQYAVLSEKIRAAIAALSEEPVKFLINTHWHYDHTGGNENFGNQDAIIVAHDNVRKRLAAGGVIEAFKRDVPPAPAAALPVITFTDSLAFHFNGNTIRVEHTAPAHTDGDAIIYFEEANVVHMGDTFFNGFYPFVDASSGGRMAGLVEAVASVLARTDDNTVIIPGHGPVSNRAELQRYHDMLQAMYGRIAALKAAGKSMEQVVAAQPSKDFDPQWGAGFLSPDQWVGLVYQAI